MSAHENPGSIHLPKSDVSAVTGLLGLASLLAWIALCRSWPEISAWFDLPGPREPMTGPHAALTGLVIAAVPMVLYSVIIEKVHLRSSTGIDWSLARTRRHGFDTAIVKLIGLWATWAVLAALYCLGRWYWNGSYEFALTVLAYAVGPMIVLSIPYVIWLDRVMIEPRDHSWHFGALVLGRDGWEADEVKRHWRAWIIKGFFGAFMISIVPGGFAYVVGTRIEDLFANPAALGLLLIQLLFVIDVQIGTVGYLLTMRPLDAHIRSGNPFVSGWLAALVCYPPFVWGIIGNGQILNYEENTRDWVFWFSGNDILLWAWAAWLVFLTVVYAWATFAFGIRFSNLTYRGVLTNGPYRFTRHPAYVSKNLFWWCSTLPFLVVSDSWVDVIRNCFCLAVVNGIYLWRSKTEEAHLLAEDPKYVAYHAWMAQHGLLTAPLERARRALMGLRLPMMARQPAE
ncbi:MAG: methyltransferase family protein [Qipengyuania sp.]